MADNSTTPAPSVPAPDITPQVPADARLFQSADLFSGQREVLIVHGQQLYRLRLTRANKLILHK